MRRHRLPRILPNAPTVVSLALVLCFAGVWAVDPYPYDPDPPYDGGSWTYPAGFRLGRWRGGTPTRVTSLLGFQYAEFSGPRLGVAEQPHSLLVVPYWPVVLATSILPLRWSARRLRTHSRSRLARCVECGYDLRTTPGRCPECGRIPAGVNG